MQMKSIKKMAFLAGAAITVTSLYVGPSRANDNTTYLQQIAQNTANILTAVNTLPNYITQMLAYATNMTATDTAMDGSSLTPTLQGYFTTTGNQFTQDPALQLAKQPSLNKDMFNAQVVPGVLAALPPPQNANDLVYSTLLGSPFYSTDPRQPKPSDLPYNYIKTASGINILHMMPSGGASWNGYPSDYARYQSYYNTVMSVESYNGYILSNQYEEALNNNALTTAQMQLVSQATGSSWFTAITSESIGVVLRQLLMFESQSYVLQTQILQTEKQMLAAQVMTNTLLIATGMYDEEQLLTRAEKKTPH
jgi:hypothetical protein